MGGRTRPELPGQWAHDIFMNVLADQGFIGLLLFLALLAYVSLRSIGAWRRLRTLERGETEADEVREEAQRHRITVAMVTASMVAYIVQAVFNVQQVGLSFSFWLLIGCSTVMALAVGVPDTLRPKSLVAATPDLGSFLEQPSPTTGRSARPRHGRPVPPAGASAKVLAAGRTPCPGGRSGSGR